MIEFVQQHDVGPFAAARARFEAAGMACALHAEMQDGFTFLMRDAVERYGHFIELYEAGPTLSEFYAFVATAAMDYDGRDPIRDINR